MPHHRTGPETVVDHPLGGGHQITDVGDQGRLLEVAITVTEAGFFELMQSVLPQGGPATFELDDPGPLGDLGNVPLVVIGDDQSATFLNDSFDDNTGADPGTGARVGSGVGRRTLLLHRPVVGVAADHDLGK